MATATITIAASVCRILIAPLRSAPLRLRVLRSLSVLDLRTDRVSQQLEVPRARYFNDAERTQVLGLPLHIEQGHPRSPHQVDQRGERHLGRVALPVEHRFTREQ